MKKMKSMLISMGAITTLTVPVVLAVSCGDTKPAAAKPEDETTEVDQTTQTGNQNPTGNPDTTTQTGDEHQGSTPASNPVWDQVKATAGTVITELTNIRGETDATVRRNMIIEDVKTVAPEVLAAVMAISHLAPVETLITSNIDAISTFVIGLRDKLTELLKTVPVINGLLFEKEVDANGVITYTHIKTDTSGIDALNTKINNLVGTKENIFTKINHVLDRVLAEAKFVFVDADATTLARLNDLYYGNVSIEDIYLEYPMIQSLVMDVNAVINFVNSDAFDNLIATIKDVVDQLQVDGLTKSISRELKVILDLDQVKQLVDSMSDVIGQVVVGLLDLVQSVISSMDPITIPVVGSMIGGPIDIASIFFDGDHVRDTFEITTLTRTNRPPLTEISQWTKSQGQQLWTKQYSASEPIDKLLNLANGGLSMLQNLGISPELINKITPIIHAIGTSNDLLIAFNTLFDELDVQTINDLIDVYAETKTAEEFNRLHPHVKTLVDYFKGILGALPENAIHNLITGLTHPTEPTAPDATTTP